MKKLLKAFYFVNSFPKIDITFYYSEINFNSYDDVVKIRLKKIDFYYYKYYWYGHYICFSYIDKCKYNKKFIL